MAIEWNETKDIMREVEELFQRDDDLQDLHDILKMSKEIDVYYNNNIKDLKEKIKSLTVALNKKEFEVAAPSEEEHIATVQRYIDRKEELQTYLNHLRDRIDAKRDNISSVIRNTSSLKEKISEYSINLQFQDSRTAYAISLYSKISHIIWNYSGPSTRLTGHCMNDKKNEINQFDIDANLNQYDITKQLWDVIAESVE